MKAKRILNTLVVVLSIVFLMNGVSMAVEQRQIGIINPVFSCSMSVALFGFCIESTNPAQGYAFPPAGGTGTITVYYPKLTAISATSNSPSVTITGFRILDANHLLISYSVGSRPSCGHDVSFKIATITVRGAAKGYRNVDIVQNVCYNP